MTFVATMKCALYLGALLLLAVPLGAYMARVYTGKAKLAERAFGPLERLRTVASRLGPGSAEATRLPVLAASSTRWPADCKTVRPPSCRRPESCGE